MPFFAEMKTPALFTEGDKATILSSIHNYSGEKQTVRTTFTGSVDSTVIKQKEREMIFIGERINGGFKDISQAVRDKDKSVLQKWAQIQAKAGADGKITESGDPDGDHGQES